MSAGSTPSAQAIELLRLRLRNERSAPETARQAMQAPLQGHDISPRALYRLELVLEESLMNRLWHAFPEGGEREILLTLGLLPDALVLCIEDDGIAFDPLQAPPPRPHTTLDEAEPGGLGLMLTRKAARHCHYERIGGRNRFTVHIDRV